MTRANLLPFWPEECDAWAEIEDLTVSEWADRHRVLTYKAAKSGPWETSFNPVMRRVMDAFSYDCVEELSLVKPTQVGGTDGPVLNSIGYCVTQDPGTCLVVEPTEDLANELSKDRIDDMIEHCDALKAALSNNPTETTKKKKTFKSMSVYFGWAGSPTSLASRPCRYVFFDEVNKYPPFSGQEASPLKLGKERTNTFKESRKIVYLSTPTTQDGYITKQEAQAQARFRYLISCPHCGHKQQLVLTQVKFGEDHTPSVVEESAWYECEKCTGRITEDQRMELIRRGDWHDIVSGMSFDECMKKLRPKSVGFQFNRLYTPWFTFGEVAAEFLRSKDVPEALMNFKNSWMAEEWVEQIETKTEDELAMNRIEIAPVMCPKDTLGLTCGVDPGQGGFWYVVLSWDKIFSPHLVQRGFLPDFDSVRRLWFDYVYRVQGLAYPIKIWRKGMDTGGSKYDNESETMTAAAYDFLRGVQDGATFGTKGDEQMRAGQNLTVKMIDKMPGPTGKPIPGGLPVCFLRPSYFKNVIHMRLAVKEGDPGRYTFNQSITAQDDYIKHLRGEVKQRNRKTGKFEWIATGANHYFDATVIAFALADPECFGGVRVLEPLPKEDIPAEAVETDEKEEGDWITEGKSKSWI